MRLTRSRSEYLNCREDEREEGAELGGRGRGTAREGSRCGIGRVRSERRRGRLARLVADPDGDDGWRGLMIRSPENSKAQD